MTNTATTTPATTTMPAFVRCDLSYVTPDGTEYVWGKVAAPMLGGYDGRVSIAKALRSANFRAIRWDGVMRVGGGVYAEFDRMGVMDAPRAYAETSLTTFTATLAYDQGVLTGVEVTDCDDDAAAVIANAQALANQLAADADARHATR